MEWLTDIVGQLYKWPVWLALATFSIVVGVMLKKAKFFPNRFIPWVVVPLNAVGFWYFGNPGTVSPECIHPEGVLAIYGTILGFLAWGAHAFILKKLAGFLPAGVISFDTDEYRKEKGPNENTDKTDDP